MKISQRVVRWLAKRGVLQDPNSWLSRHFVRQTQSGIEVTEQSALTFSAVFSCVSVLSRSLAAMPLPVYQRRGRGRERAREHPAYNLLHSQPNREMTSYTFRSTLMAHLALWGNAYAEIVKERDGTPQSLWMIPPWRVEPMRTADKGNLYYEVELPNGQKKELQPYRMLHIMGLGVDGNKGLSPIAMHRQGVGMGLAAEEFGARFFGQGTNLGGIIEIPGKMRDETIRGLRADIQSKHEGLGKSHRLLFLEEGLKYHQAGMPMTDAQFLESRKFQINEVARIYNIPPHMIGDLDRATFSNIEHQTIEFVTHTMTPWLVNWEQELNRKMFTGDDYYAEFLVEGLLRGDSQSRAQFYNQMFNIGAYSINDIREKENENPIGPEGDVHYVPMNMIPANAAKVAEPEQEQEQEQKRFLEKRSLEYRQQGATRRNKIKNSYRNLFSEATAKIVQREKTNILKGVRKHLQERSLTSFTEWLEDYYREFPEYIRNQMLPVMNSMAESIQELAAQEVGADVGMTPEMERFMDEYVTVFTARYTGSSRGQIVALANKAADEGENIAAAIEQRLTEWEQRRPNKVAMNETVQLGSAVAVAVFAAAGVNRLRWHAIGAENCEFCQEMDGKVVSVDQPFLAKDDVLEAEGREGQNIQLNRPTMHPPLHQFCVCEIIPD